MIAFLGVSASDFGISVSVERAVSQTQTPRRSPRMVGHAEAFHLAAVSGRKAEAQKVLDQLTVLSKQKCVPTLDMVIYAGLGEKDKALECLEKAHEDRSVGSSFANISVNPEYDPLRSDPRLQDLLRRMNLRP